ARGAMDAAEAAASSRGQQPCAEDLRRHTALLAQCAASSQWPRALELLGGMAREALWPGVIAYNAAANACGRGRGWQHAVALLSRMREEALRPNAITHSTVVGACQRARALEPLRGLLREALRGGASLDRVACSTYARACALRSWWQTALGLLGAAASAGVELDAAAFNWRAARMRSRGIELSAAACNAAAAACRRGEQWSWALRLLAAQRRWRMDPTLTAHNDAAAALGLAGLPHRLGRLLPGALRAAAAAGPREEEDSWPFLLGQQGPGAAGAHRLYWRACAPVAARLGLSRAPRVGTPWAPWSSPPWSLAWSSSSPPWSSPQSSAWSSSSSSSS
ncbi:unnamed protein product, partial [Prorocentrum cordatum]